MKAVYSATTVTGLALLVGIRNNSALVSVTHAVVPFVYSPIVRFLLAVLFLGGKDHSDNWQLLPLVCCLLRWNLTVRTLNTSF